MVMKNYRATLPPLDTLVFFEAAARHLNFSRAAEELEVSQTAVSKRIRQLEDHLDISLFLRDGRKITLTPEGQMFAQKCRTLLDHAVQSLPNAAPKDAAIQLACCSAISLFWLDERLGDYMQHPWSPVVNCMTTDDPDLLLNTQFDLTILYGAGTWEGWEAQPLFENDEVAVVAPAGKEANLEWEAQNTPPILIDTCVPKQGPRWVLWPEFPNLKFRNQEPCSSYADTLKRAKAGHGIALVSQALVAHDLQSGHLQTLTEPRRNADATYYIAWPKEHPLSPAAAALRDHLLSASSSSS